MADDTDMVVYTAVYDDLNDALADLDGIEQMHEDSVIGKYDAAVIDQENGKPKIVKRMDSPRIRVIAETFDSGPLPRNQLRDAAKELGTGQAALILAGEPTLEQAFDEAVTKADKVIKRSLDATIDEIAAELQDAE
jgi:hypothetical protein